MTVANVDLAGDPCANVQLFFPHAWQHTIVLQDDECREGRKW